MFRRNLAHIYWGRFLLSLEQCPTQTCQYVFKGTQWVYLPEKCKKKVALLHTFIVFLCVEGWGHKSHIWTQLHVVYITSDILTKWIIWMTCAPKCHTVLWPLYRKFYNLRTFIFIGGLMNPPLYQLFVLLPQVSWLWRGPSRLAVPPCSKMLHELALSPGPRL